MLCYIRSLPKRAPCVFRKESLVRCPVNKRVVYSSVVALFALVFCLASLLSKLLSAVHLDRVCQIGL